jgi:hypothetical protein
MIKKDVEKTARISQSEYFKFNTRWTLPDNHFDRKFDYIKVDYHFVTAEVQRMVRDVLEVTLPREDMDSLTAEILYCQEKKVLKFFGTNLWTQPAEENQVSTTFGMIAATCKQHNVELLTYKSTVHAVALPNKTIQEEQKKEDRTLLNKWLALHFIAEFN